MTFNDIIKVERMECEVTYTTWHGWLNGVEGDYINVLGIDLPNGDHITPDSDYPCECD